MARAPHVTPVRVLITSSFVLLNFPKTGSSFVRSVLKAIYRRRRWTCHADRFLREVMLPHTNARPDIVDQHGTFAQIPEAYRDLPVVSVLRDPYERLLSAYEFRWWVRQPPLPHEQALAAFPHFPALSLEDFVRLNELAVAAALGGRNPLGLGKQTYDFVRFFFREPERAFGLLSDGYVASGAFRRDMADIVFLRQEHLRADLAGFLSRCGFSTREVEMCWRHARINETRGDMGSRQTLWTPQALARVRSTESRLFAMLRQLGFDYEAPSLAAATGAAAEAGP